MLPENIIYLAVLVSFIGYFFYFKDIFYGQTRPNLVSWVLWLLGPFLGVFFQIKAGAGLSVIPTYVKGWKFPETEHYGIYIASVFSNTLGLLIIKDWSFTIYSFGVYLVLANLVFVLILYRKKFFKS